MTSKSLAHHLLNGLYWAISIPRWLIFGMTRNEELKWTPEVRPNPEMTRCYERIRRGQSRNEVECLIGFPGIEEPGAIEELTEVRWNRGGNCILVSFVKGEVREKAYGNA